jgi:hypothetical protein
MCSYAEFIIETDIPVALSNHCKFQNGADLLFVEDNTKLNWVNVGEYGDWDLDCAGVYCRDGYDFIFDVISEPGEWEWN